ncbi:EpsG family protein [Pseudomonas sp. QLc11A]|uniref:EpsG family protein n=1 Tax=Pseudomonas azerbaijanorientalis TaxID=2842350 RepID=A0ABW8WAN6_9PSED
MQEKQQEFSFVYSVVRSLFSFNLYVLFLVLAFCSFYSAQESFSYDYIFYIGYFDAIQKMQLEDIFFSLQSNLPFIYVSIPPSGLLEVGFVLFVRALFFITESPELVYALIATISLMTRVFIMRRLGINWAWIVLINIYAITLFEANAIRAGCALTLIIFGGYCLLKDRKLIGFALLVSSTAFHVQAAFVFCFFCFFWLFYNFFNQSALKLALTGIGLGVSGLVVDKALALLNVSKMEDYSGKYVASVGINSISMAGILLVGVFFYKVVSSRKYVLESMDLEGRTLLPFLISSVPALSALVFATSLGAIGDRLWQFSFVVFSVFMLRVRIRDDFRYILYLLLFLCLFISNINVLIRYPLSNFLYPLIPYINIVPKF